MSYKGNVITALRSVFWVVWAARGRVTNKKLSVALVYLSG